jgi:hypothetical protein
MFCRPFAISPQPHERLRLRRPLAHRDGRLEDAEIVVVAARDEVALELGRELEIRLANPVHPLHPGRVLPVDLSEPDRGGDAEEYTTGSKTGERDETGSEVGRLADERQRDDRARQGRDEDRGPLMASV